MKVFWKGVWGRTFCSQKVFPRKIINQHFPTSLIKGVTYTEKSNMPQNTRRKQAQPAQPAKKVPKNVPKNAEAHEANGAVKREGGEPAPTDGKSAAPPRTFTFSVGFSAVMTMLLVLVGGVVVAFMLGVIVGRGQENTIENRGVSMPLTVVKQAGKNANADDKSPHVTSSKAKADGTKKIMTPEELNYAKELKHKEQNRPTPETDADKNAADDTSNEQKAAEKKGATEKKGAASSPADGAQKTATIFNFLFQVSSLKDEKSVDTLRAELEADGMRTRSTKVGEYYIVYVMVRGTQRQADETRARLIELKLGNPLLKQKTAVR